MDKAPQSERGRDYLKDLRERERNGETIQRPLRLLTYHDIPNIPLFIIYYTAYPDPETHHLQFHSDIYGYDRVLLRAAQSLIP